MRRMDANWEEHDPFLQLAQEDPDDDGPRLIYADWLEDREDPTWAAYAEFIRIQIECVRLKNRSKHRRARLALRQEELLAAHARDWLGPWGNVPYRWVYRRGIPDRIHARATGHWIGRQLDRDGGFPDRIERNEQGRITVDYGDLNWPGFWPTVEGTYHIHFTFARVQMAVVLWDVQEHHRRYQGWFTSSGRRLEFQEQDGRQSPDYSPVSLDLKSPDRWWG